MICTQVLVPYFFAPMTHSNFWGHLLGACPKFLSCQPKRLLFMGSRGMFNDIIPFSAERVLIGPAHLKQMQGPFPCPSIRWPAHLIGSVTWLKHGVSEALPSNNVTDKYVTDRFAVLLQITCNLMIISIKNIITFFFFTKRT